MLRREENTVPEWIVAKFQAWKELYNRRYASVEIENLKLSIYFKNFLHIQRENAAQTEYVLGETQFMDITTEEFIATYLGHVATKTEEFAQDEHVEVNGAFNWATKGAVTPVKD